LREKDRFLIACHENPEGERNRLGTGPGARLAEDGETATVLNADPGTGTCCSWAGADTVVFEEGRVEVRRRDRGRLRLARPHR
jgi:hypothetical protein